MKVLHPLLSKAIGLVLVLALLATALPAPMPVLAADNCAKKYTVVAGDTLSKIALANNITVAELAAANNLKEPYTITIGQVLCIPASSTTTSTSGDTTTTTTSSGPSLTASRDGRLVTVTIKSFPTQTMFFVRISEGRRNPVAYRLGYMKTKKSGDLSKTFKLPKELWNVSYFTVCAKNTTTDALLCKYVYLPAPTQAK